MDPRGQTGEIPLTFRVLQQFICFRLEGEEGCRLQSLGLKKQETSTEVGGKQSSFPPKRRLNFSGLHGIISKKIELFITTGVRT
jgi:hypothetical protein